MERLKLRFMIMVLRLLVDIRFNEKEKISCYDAIRLIDDLEREWGKK